MGVASLLLFLATSSIAVHGLQDNLQQSCGEIPTDTVPLNLPIVISLHANGTRNYTCGPPDEEGYRYTIIGDADGTALFKFAMPGTDNFTAGKAYYTNDSRFILTVEDNAAGLTGQLELESQDIGVSPVFQQSPNKDSIAWCRWRVANATGTALMQNVTYVARINTLGGKQPEDCPLDADEVTVPFQADYVFYTCTSNALSSFNSSLLFPILMVVFTITSSIFS